MFTFNHDTLGRLLGATRDDTRADEPVPAPTADPTRTRRAVLKLVGGGALAAALVGLGAAGGAAKPNRKKHGNRRDDRRRGGHAGKGDKDDKGTDGSRPGAAALGNCVTVNEQALLKLINDYRVANGRTRLVMSDTLAAAAYFHSRDMATRTYFSHVTKGTQNHADVRMTAAGYPFIGQTAWGENIHWGTGSLGTPQAVFTSWKNSPGHNANMLGRTFAAAGVGRHVAANGKIYSTLNLAGRLDKRALTCWGTPA